MATKSKSNKRTAGPEDKHIGERLRLARVKKGMSQADLGAQFNVSFQQIQKYEKGANRISAARLAQMAAALQVPFTYFTEGLAGGGTGSNGAKKDGVQSMLTDPDVFKLCEVLQAIPSKEHRVAILQVARAVARVA